MRISDWSSDVCSSDLAEGCGARPLAEVLDAFESAEAAAAPVYSMADIATDPHYKARGSIVEVDGVPMQGLIAHLSGTPGELRWPGPATVGSPDPPAWAPRANLRHSVVPPTTPCPRFPPPHPRHPSLPPHPPPIRS